MADDPSFLVHQRLFIENDFITARELAALVNVSLSEAQSILKEYLQHCRANSRGKIWASMVVHGTSIDDREVFQVVPEDELSNPLNFKLVHQSFVYSLHPVKEIELEHCALKNIPISISPPIFNAENKYTGPEKPVMTPEIYAMLAKNGHVAQVNNAFGIDFSDDEELIKTSSIPSNNAGIQTAPNQKPVESRIPEPTDQPAPKKTKQGSLLSFFGKK